jgi:hypothetical protein
MTLPLIHDLLASGPISVAADTTLKATILLKFESEQACDDWVISAMRSNNRPSWSPFPDWRN